MSVLESTLRRPGGFVLRQYYLVRDLGSLGIHTVKGLKRLFKPAGMGIFLKQIYFTSVQPIPMVIAGALVMGAVIVHYIIAFFTSIGARQEIGRFVLLVIVNELSSVFVAILVMIRSGSAVIAELALMKLNNELNTLRSLDINIYEYLLSPRFAAIVASNVLLSVLFCFVALLGGFISFGYINNIPFYDYIERMAGAAGIPDFVAVYIKSLVFGIIIALVSIKDGLGVGRSISEVPVKLIHGLVIQVMLIAIFNILYDMLRYGDII